MRYSILLILMSLVLACSSNSRFGPTDYGGGGGFSPPVSSPQSANPKPRYHNVEIRSTIPGSMVEVYSQPFQEVRAFLWMNVPNLIPTTYIADFYENWEDNGEEADPFFQLVDFEWKPGLTTRGYLWRGHANVLWGDYPDEADSVLLDFPENVWIPAAMYTDVVVQVPDDSRAFVVMGRAFWRRGMDVPGGTYLSWSQAARRGWIQCRDKTSDQLLEWKECAKYKPDLLLEFRTPVKWERPDPHPWLPA